MYLLCYSATLNHLQNTYSTSNENMKRTYCVIYILAHFKKCELGIKTLDVKRRFIRLAGSNGKDDIFVGKAFSLRLLTSEVRFLF